MPVLGPEFVDLAHKMLSPQISEAEARAVINRAYYGAFHVAKTAAKNNNEGGSCHGDVIDHFKGRNNYVYNSLKNLFKARKKADYKLGENVSRREAEVSCALARKLIGTL